MSSEGHEVVRFEPGAQAARNCPNCNVTLGPYDACEISWSENEKQYQVKLTSSHPSCPYCAHALPNPGALAVAIAERSNCSCGNALRLTDHRIARAGHSFELEAKYVCDSCGAKARSEKGILRKLFGEFWRSTKKVKVGPVEYEKTAGDNP